MILDALLQFSNAQNLAQVAGTYASTNILDLHMAGIPVLANLQGARDIGIGDDPALILVVQSIAAFTAAGAATMTIALQYSADNVTYYVAAEVPVIPKASMGANTKLVQMPLPHRPPQMAAFNLLPRYMKLTYTVATGPMTAGSIYAGILLDAQANIAYAPGIAIAN